MDNELIELFKEIEKISTNEFNRLTRLVDDIIKNKITNEKIISDIFDSILSIVFIDEDTKKEVFYKLFDYCKEFNPILAYDYELIFKDMLYDESIFFEYGKIVYPAILYNNCIYMSCKGHYDILNMEDIGVLKKGVQGFVTENGYFVDRELGLLIAKYYKQIEYKYNPKNELLTEDLKKEDLKLLRKIDKYSYKFNIN